MATYLRLASQCQMPQTCFASALLTLQCGLSSQRHAQAPPAIAEARATDVTRSHALHAHDAAVGTSRGLLAGLREFVAGL
eukprot:CAMPEP_0171247404 /NCGR_PEP_ID=MMETSP0790-20130122/48478_1 /TAXON_ID=2925 /ORGANISM="Alexandrium catenella, Strain OF101" /LENGTH=79 /DNA_ID=CAMNT_0011714813 /DNA_START=127 /DNA_END=363 /DNA_ORIENTATION=+